jgi:hypothetical protein
MQMIHTPGHVKCQACVANGIAIWWLDESECRLILGDLGLVGRLPSYIVVEMDSMQGRPKRGRLWFPNGIEGFDLPATPTIDSLFFFTRGGLAIMAEHAISTYGLPGYLTTVDLRPWFGRAS